MPTKRSITTSLTGKPPAPWTAPKIASLLSLAHRMAKGPSGGLKNERGVVSVKVVADPEMKRLNKQWRGKDKTTDVLSFSYLNVIPAKAGIQKKNRPMDPRLRGDDSMEFGDIIISLPQVRRQAKAIGRSASDEFALMLVHGLLHILGHDHETLAQENKMFALQHEILLRAKIW